MYACVCVCVCVCVRERERECVCTLPSAPHPYPRVLSDSIYHPFTPSHSAHRPRYLIGNSTLHGPVPLVWRTKHPICPEGFHLPTTLCLPAAYSGIPRWCGIETRCSEVNHCRGITCGGEQSRCSTSKAGYTCSCGAGWRGGGLGATCIGQYPPLGCGGRV